MANNRAVATAIDFGSSTINVVIAERGVNNTFNILGRSEVEYDGFIDGEFLEPDKIYGALGQAINIAESSAGIPIRDVYVGVPGEFTSVVVRNPSLTFHNPTRITNIEVEKLYELGGSSLQELLDYELINRSPIYYEFHDGIKKIDPRDCKTTKITAQLSYVLASKNFTNVVTPLLAQHGIEKIEYLSSCLAESIFLTDYKERDEFVVLVDIGYLTTNVMLIRGEGLLYLKSFSIGGGHIMSDLREKFAVPYYVAEELKRQVSLVLTPNDTDEYTVLSKNQEYPFLVQDVHETVVARITQICKMVKSCMNMCKIEHPERKPYFITGGGVSYTRGAVDRMSEILGRKVSVLKKSTPQQDKPNMASTYAILDQALQQKKKKGIFSKLFK